MTNRLAQEVVPMLATVWLMLASLLHSLQLSTGSFLKPMTEEASCLKLAAQSDVVVDGTSTSLHIS